MRPFVIGNENCVLGFGLVGVQGQVTSSAEQLASALDASLSDSTIGLLLVSSDVAGWQRERIDALKAESLSPLVVELPGQDSQDGYPSLKEVVQRAVGVSLGG